MRAILFSHNGRNFWKVADDNELIEITNSLQRYNIWWEWVAFFLLFCFLFFVDLTNKLLDNEG